jgi:hypothetical protein
MFSSNTRRASTVSAVADNEEPGLAGRGAQLIVTRTATRWRDGILADGIQLCGKNVSAILTGVATIGDSGLSLLLADDLLENT